MTQAFSDSLDRRTFLIAIEPLLSGVSTSLMLSSLAGLQSVLKGFFLRLGYQAGLKDAEMARKLRPSSPELEMFLVGPQLHALKGGILIKSVTGRHGFTK
jgi:hypothetical protein